VVLACLAIGAFGGAILRTQILPRWVGAMAVAWALVWAVFYLVRMGKAPLGPNLIPLSSVWSCSSTALDTGPRRALLASLPLTARDAAGGADEDGPPLSVNPAGAWPRPGLPVRQSPAPQAQVTTWTRPLACSAGPSRPGWPGRRPCPESQSSQSGFFAPMLVLPGAAAAGVVLPVRPPDRAASALTHRL
jgi:hypothetical protein